MCQKHCKVLQNRYLHEFWFWNWNVRVLTPNSSQFASENWPKKPCRNWRNQFWAISEPQTSSTWVRQTFFGLILTIMDAKMTCLGAISALSRKAKLVKNTVGYYKIVICTKFASQLECSCSDTKLISICIQKLTKKPMSELRKSILSQVRSPNLLCLSPADLPPLCLGTCGCQNAEPGCNFSSFARGKTW